MTYEQTPVEPVGPHNSPEELEPLQLIGTRKLADYDDWAVMREPTTPVTVRLDDQSIRQLYGLAMLDETHLAAQIRRAAHEYVASRRADPDFPAQVAAARQALTRMMGDE